MRPTTLPRPVFDIKGWTTCTSLESPGLTEDIGSNESPLGLSFLLLRPRRLKFIKFLGSGAFGCVYLAADIGESSHPGDEGLASTDWTADSPSLYLEPRLPRFYAVKCMDNQQVPRRRRVRELEAHRAALGHPGVLDLYACVQQDGWTFLVFEYAESGDMLQCTQDLNPYATSDVMIRSVFGQVVDAVQHCHRKGVFHRDIKPENIMCRKGGKEVALGDFGLATTQAENTGFGTGSKHFMSPECLRHGYLAHKTQPKNWQPVPFNSAKSDIWSLGILLSTMISNGTAWGRADSSDGGFMHYLRQPLVLRDILPISWAALELLHRMLDVNPSSRIPIALVKNKLRDIRTFRMTPWELEGASLSIQVAAKEWLPRNYMRLEPQPWTRYATYPEHLGRPHLDASQSPEIGAHHAMRPPNWPCLWEAESCSPAASEDIVPSLDPSRTESHNQTSLPITPAAVDVADPLIIGDHVPELDLADGLEAYADRLRIERWISDCAGASAV